MTEKEWIENNKGKRYENMAENVWQENKIKIFVYCTYIHMMLRMKKKKEDKVITIEYMKRKEGKK